MKNKKGKLMLDKTKKPQKHEKHLFINSYNRCCFCSPKLLPDFTFTGRRTAIL